MTLVNNNAVTKISKLLMNFKCNLVLVGKDKIGRLAFFESLTGIKLKGKLAVRRNYKYRKLSTKDFY